MRAGHAEERDRGQQGRQGGEGGECCLPACLALPSTHRLHTHPSSVAPPPSFPHPTPPHPAGFIDLRRVQQVREVAKPVTLDGAKGSGGGGFMSKLFSRGGGSASARNVVELVTPGRIYNLAPATIAMPSPMTTSAALANAAGSKPLYLFGWPFPVPAMDGGDDEAEVAGAFVEGKLPEDSFTQWRDVLATAVAAEKATRTYPVTTLVDSTGQLPQRVFLRTTPCELAIVSMEDKDLCFAALPYNDLVKWDCPVEGEIHVTARTRARLVAKPDRSGFSSQRPTRSTCHFVFKCSEARGITSVRGCVRVEAAGGLCGCGCERCCCCRRSAGLAGWWLSQPAAPRVCAGGLQLRLGLPRPLRNTCCLLLSVDPSTPPLSLSVSPSLHCR